jgi:hypothetical protein
MPNSVAEALRKLGIKKTKFYQEVNEGRLAAKKNGSRTVVLDEEIDRYLSELPPYEPKNPHRH